MNTINVNDLVFGDDWNPDHPLIRTFIDEIRNGRPLKMPTVMKQPDGRYVIVDGRKRLEAARRCGETEFTAYVVEQIDPEKFEQLRKTLNGVTRPNN
jgi:ParB-like chromosome segregation protein Spo0J